MQAKKRIKNLTAEIFILAGSLIVLILSSSACKEDNVPTPTPVKDVVKNPEKKNEEKLDADKKNSAGEIKREYSYNPNGKVDPFTPLITSSPNFESAPAEAKEKKDVPLSPLQKLDIDDFTLVAIISSDNKLTALLEDPAVNGFIVTEGLLIGKNGGVIKKILSNSMLIEELSLNEQGKKELKIKTITLKKK